MADKPFDRRVYRQRERPVSTDLNENSSWSHMSTMEIMDRLQGRRIATTEAAQALVPYTSFMGDGFRVEPASPLAMSVTIRPGLGFFVDAADAPTDIGSGDAVPMTGVDDISRLKPLVLSATETINVPSAHPANPRIDIVEVKTSRRQTDSSNREILNAGTGIFASNAVNKTLTFEPIISFFFVST